MRICGHFWKVESGMTRLETLGSMFRSADKNLGKWGSADLNVCSSIARSYGTCT